MKNILRENMRRFGTKNLTEVATVTKGRKSSELVGRSVTLWGNEAQSGSEIMYMYIADTHYDHAKRRFQVVGLDMSDEEKVAAFNAGESVAASIEIMFEPGNKTNVFFDMYTGTKFYNRWLAGELNKIYHSN